MDTADNTLSGSASGPVVQAHALHGGVHFHQAVGLAPMVFSRQLLPPPARFTNRVPELSALDEMLEESAPLVVVLKGLSGVGKTTLALRWLHRISRRFSDAQLYADLQPVKDKPADPDDVLGQFLRALGVPPLQVPHHPAELRAMFRSVTADLSLVMLLDNAVSAAQVGGMLPASERSVVVITSRWPLSRLLTTGARLLHVDPLDDVNALALLESRIGTARVRAERASALRLVRCCGGLALALCVLGARIAQRPHRPLATVVADLTDGRNRMTALSTKDGDLIMTENLDTAYAELPDEAQHLYWAVALHPGGVFGVDVAAVATQASVRRTQDMLDVLADANLVVELPDGYYKLDQAVRAHAEQQAYGTDEDQAAVVLRMLRWYLFAAQAANRLAYPARRILAYTFDPATAARDVPADLDGPAGARRWLDRHRPNLIAATERAFDLGEDELCCQLADVVLAMCVLFGLTDDEAAVSKIGLQAARRWGHPGTINSLGKRHARALAYLGKFAQADQQALALLQDARARKDRRGESSHLKTKAIILYERAYAAARDGRALEAAKLYAASSVIFRDALDILRALDRPRGEGLTLIELGKALVGFAEIQDAQEAFRQAQDLLVNLDEPDLYNAARAEYYLARTHQHAGDPDTARELYRLARTGFAAHGAEHYLVKVERALAELETS